MKKEYLEAGKIINTHGVRGDVKIDCWCDSPSVICDAGKFYLLENDEYKVIELDKATEAMQEEMSLIYQAMLSTSTEPDEEEEEEE